MSTPFSAGPRLVGPPGGDPTAQAIASLRGYAYQLYTSALAWLDLRGNQELYLEVAKDYATVAADALNAVEVKNTKGSVTINSPDVRDTLDAFVDLVERNAGRTVSLRFLSTSSIGVERAAQHRVGPDGTLNYWRRAAAGADVAPLRHVLLQLDLSARAKAFVSDRNDSDLRAELLRRVHWDCGGPTLDDLKDELNARLTVYGADRLRLPPAEHSRLTAIVLQHVLMTIVGVTPRRLTEGDLLALLDSATRVSIPRRELEDLLRGLAYQGGEQSGTAQWPAKARLHILDPEDTIPLPSALALRHSLVDDVLSRVRRARVTCISGGTGRGKTLLARLCARSHGGKWYIADLRNADASETAERIRHTLADLSLSDATGLILDDLNEVEDPAVRRSLNRLTQALHRRDALCLITAYREPSARAFSELGITNSEHLSVPDLTVAELGELIGAAGGDPAVWSNGVYFASEFGHPQLAQAVIAGLRLRGWPQAELRDLRSFARSSDVEAEQRATRQRLVAAVPDEARSLLYRVSLLVGRFDRATALSLGALPRPVSQPGRQLDALIGPWVDRAAKDQLRISPLLANAGEEVLAPNEQQSIHRAVADAIVGAPQLDLTKANVGFMHALRGKAESQLFRVGNSILMAPADIRRMLPDWMPALRLHRTDRPIYSEKPTISNLLRLAQLLLLLEKDDTARIAKCWSALVTELQSESNAEARERFELVILSKVLTHSSLSSAVPEWIDLVLRSDHLLRSRPEGRKFSTSMKKALRGRVRTPVGMFFVMQSLGLRKVAELGAAFDRLDALSSEQRAKLFADVFEMPSDFSMIVNHAWLEEHKAGTIDWMEAAHLYERMAAQALQWGYRELALRCHVARGVMFDEYGETADGALQALDNAVKLLGSDPVLSRARAKILYRRRDHAAALQLLREAACKAAINDPVERTFMLREAGISAAEVGKWAEARSWFASAREAASAAQGPEMKAMQVGLRADEAVAAYKSGDVASAISGLAETVAEMTAFDPESSLKWAYCHRVVGHTVLWLFGQTAERRALSVNGEPVLIAPGACSNPEPPEEIKEKPLGPIAVPWYLLAESEVAAGVNVGVADGLRARLQDRAIPSLEIGLRNARLSRAMQDRNPEAFVQNLVGWVEADLYLKANNETILTQDIMNPNYGEIEPVSPERLQSPEAVLSIEDSVLAFGLVAALAQDRAALQSLHDQFASAMPADFPGRRIVMLMIDEGAVGDSLENYIADQIRKSRSAVILIRTMFSSPDCVLFSALNDRISSASLSHA